MQFIEIVLGEGAVSDVLYGIVVVSRSEVAEIGQMDAGLKTANSLVHNCLQICGQRIE